MSAPSEDKHTHRAPLSVRALLVFQGSYYVLTGLWPLVHMPSFLMVSGDKTDLWLVEMVGLLAAVGGVYLLVSAARRRVTFETLVIVFGYSAAFTAIDVIYVFRGVILWTYLLDAAIHVVLVGLWLAVGLRALKRKPANVEDPSASRA